MAVINSRPPRTRARWDPLRLSPPWPPFRSRGLLPGSPKAGGGGGAPRQEIWSRHNSRAMRERTKTLSIRAIFTLPFPFGGKKSSSSPIILPLKEKRKLSSQAAAQNLLVHSSLPAGSSGRSLTGTGTPAHWPRTRGPIGPREGERSLRLGPEQSPLRG